MCGQAYKIGPQCPFLAFTPACCLPSWCCIHAVTAVVFSCSSHSVFPASDFHYFLSLLWMPSLLRVLPKDSKPESLKNKACLLLFVLPHPAWENKLRPYTLLLLRQLLLERIYLGCQIVNKYLRKVNAQDFTASGDVWISVCHSYSGRRRLFLPSKLIKGRHDAN